MPETPASTSRRALLFGTAAVSAGALLTACTSNEPKEQAQAADNAAPVADDKPGKKVTIGFAGPQADHGWLNAINSNAKSRAKKYSDVTLEITEGSNDTAQQIGQIETLINKKVDVLVILPADGKALTQVGLKAMRAGIPVVNLDRIFNTPQAYRCWIGGDNYGMGRPSTRCGTTTTTKAWVRCAPSTRPGATTSSWSAARAPSPPWTPSRAATAC